MGRARGFSRQSRGQRKNNDIISATSMQSERCHFPFYLKWDGTNHIFETSYAQACYSTTQDVSMYEIK